jgi:hypothetical protein
MEVLHLEFQADATRDVTYLGRNGEGQCHGLDLTTAGKGSRKYLSITPINSKGCLARCHIEIPADPSLLREIGAAFIRLAETETGQHTGETSHG